MSVDLRLALLRCTGCFDGHAAWAARVVRDSDPADGDVDSIATWGQDRARRASTLRLIVARRHPRSA
jgi:hypothetical protein